MLETIERNFRWVPLISGKSTATFEAKREREIDGRNARGRERKKREKQQLRH
jgi:hypothetical protein